MSPIRYDETLLRLIRDVNEMKAALRSIAPNLPLYDIANENTPASISTSQNNYVPGNYDVLRLNATADVSITGIANGKKGRFLEIINVGTGRISFPDESTSSIAINRIATPYDQTVTLLPNARARFYYDSTQLRWTVADLPNIQGSSGRHSVLRSSTGEIESIPNATWVKITPDTIVSDDWEYWDATNQYFIIPPGENGLYSLYIHFYFSYLPSAATNYGLYMRVMKNITSFPSPLSGTLLSEIVLNANSSNGYNVYILKTVNMVLNAGDKVEVLVFTSSGGGETRSARIQSVNMPVFVFGKLG